MERALLVCHNEAAVQATVGLVGLYGKKGGGYMPLLQFQGKLVFLRVHRVGSAFGPAQDQIDVEAVVGLTGQPLNRGFGFQLRDDNNRVANAGMLDLLRDAWDRNWTVRLDVDVPDPPKQNGIILRTTLVKP